MGRKKAQEKTDGPQEYITIKLKGRSHKLLRLLSALEGVPQRTLLSQLLEEKFNALPSELRQALQRQFPNLIGENWGKPNGEDGCGNGEPGNQIILNERSKHPERLEPSNSEKCLISPGNAV